MFYQFLYFLAANIYLLLLPSVTSLVMWSMENNQSIDPSKLNVYPCFMPDEPCVDKIVEWIDAAEEFIVLQAYSFSSRKIADALIKAKDRGVNVKIFVDKSAEKKLNALGKLRENGIEIQVDKEDGKAHNKVMIIDKKHVITGSYNWTDEEYYHDSDDVVFITNMCVADKYIDNYFTLSNTYPNFGFGVYNCGSCSVPLLTNFADNEGFTQSKTRRKRKSEDYAKVDACFSNNQDCLKLICNYIRNAKKSIFMQFCSFTHEEVLNALRDARKNHIDIKILVDEKVFSDEGEKVSSLVDSGFEVRCDRSCPLGTAHSKITIIDNYLVLTGSFNYSHSAQKFNQENLLHVKNILVNGIYKEHFYGKWNKSKPLNEEDSLLPSSKRIKRE